MLARRHPSDAFGDHGVGGGRVGESLAHGSLQLRRRLLGGAGAGNELLKRVASVAPQLVGFEGEVDEIEVGNPSTEEAASGRSRTPTIVVPGASVSSTGPVCGPRMRGIDPTAHTSSTLPFGALRCVNAVDCDETV